MVATEAEVEITAIVAAKSLFRELLTRLCVQNIRETGVELNLILNLTDPSRSIPFDQIRLIKWAPK